jgi:hypothetical protein
MAAASEGMTLLLSAGAGYAFGYYGASSSALLRMGLFHAAAVDALRACSRFLSLLLLI